jgi:outer membrane receptor protein involved in Fe transport
VIALLVTHSAARAAPGAAEGEPPGPEPATAAAPGAPEPATAPTAAEPATAPGAPDPPAATAPAAPDPAATAVAPAPPEPAAEIIEVTSSAPDVPGALSIDGQVARQTAGALGEPLRALALLPGVATTIAASGYPVIRGTMPGESRYEFDGIEIPLLYHFFLGTQVIHPAFIGDVELRAGGHGADQGLLLGGLITMAPSDTTTARTELRANPVEIGVFRAQPLSRSTSLAVAARVCTLTLAAKIYDSRASVYCVDQQTRLRHVFDNGDQLTLTSLGAYDQARLPPDVAPSHPAETDEIGFHRLDGRWTRVRTGLRLRAGIETALDSLLRTSVNSPLSEQGGRAYGARVYGDGSVTLAPWITARAGLQARHRTLMHSASPLLLTRSSDPFLGQAQQVEAEGAWAALDLYAGPLRFTPGLRVDQFSTELYGSSASHVTVDPRLAIAAELPAGARAELALGLYSAPPQVTLQEPGLVIGPLPMTDGAGSLAGMNRATQAQLSIVTPLGGGLQGSFAAYYRDTRYAVDLGLAGTRVDGGICADRAVTVYRGVDTRAQGLEVMIRRDLGRSVTGWLSYSLGSLDRDLGFIQMPGEFDQRHTANAVLQWRHARWLFGATGHVHTGRPLPYRWLTACSNTASIVIDPALARRPDASWRLDLRVERAFEVAGAQVRLYLELQNATFERETLSYDAEYNSQAPYDASRSHVEANTLLLPLPLIGLEVVL